MRTRTSEPGEQDLGQERGTHTVPRLIFLPESASPGSCLPENLRVQRPCRRVLAVWLMAAGLWERALTNPWVGLTQGRALELRALISSLPAGVWLAAPSATVCRASGGAVMVEVGETVPREGLWWPGRQVTPYLADESWLPFSVPMGALSWHSQTKMFIVPLAFA